MAKYLVTHFYRPNATVCRTRIFGASDDRHLSMVRVQRSNEHQYPRSIHAIEGDHYPDIHAITYHVAGGAVLNFDHKDLIDE